MKNSTRDVLIASAAGVCLLAYVMLMAEHIPGGLVRLFVSLGFVLILGILAGATMKSSFGRKAGFILIVPAVHLLYDGIDPAKAALSVLWYLAEALLLWIGLLITHLILTKWGKTGVPAA